MDRIDAGRRAFVDALIGIPFAGLALSAQFFRDLEKRGEYFGNGSPEAKELAHRLYGIVNVGPPLKL